MAEKRFSGESLLVIDMLRVSEPDSFIPAWQDARHLICLEEIRGSLHEARKECFCLHLMIICGFTRRVFKSSTENRTGELLGKVGIHPNQAPAGWLWVLVPNLGPENRQAPPCGQNAPACSEPELSPCTERNPASPWSMVSGERGKLVILVAEDSEDDAFMLKRAFAKNGISSPLHISPNGADAISYLKGQGEYSDRKKFPFPRVLVTDLKMPMCDGFELLKWLYDHPECNLIPKIVLSASAQQEDVVKAYQLGANCYFRKPSGSIELGDLVKTMHAFWLRAEIPLMSSNC